MPCYRVTGTAYGIGMTRYTVDERANAADPDEARATVRRRLARERLSTSPDDLTAAIDEEHPPCPTT